MILSNVFKYDMLSVTVANTYTFTNSFRQMMGGRQGNGGGGGGQNP